MSKRYMTRGFIGLIGMLIVMCMQGPALHAETQPPAGAVTAGGVKILERIIFV